MGNENSKKQSKNTECFEIIEENDNPCQIKNKQVINNAIAVVKDEFNQLKSENKPNHIEENAESTDTLNTPENGDVQKGSKVVENGSTNVDVKLSLDKIVTQEVVLPHVTDTRAQNTKYSDTESQNMSAGRPSEDIRNADLKDKKKSKKAKESRKDKDTKKKEKLSKKEKKLSKKISLKEGKPASVMVENETYSGLNYVPHQENKKNTSSNCVRDLSSEVLTSKHEESKEENPDNESKTKSKILNEETNQNKINSSNENANDQEIPKENANEEESPDGSAKEHKDESKNYLQETFDLIDEVQKSIIPESTTENIATLGNQVQEEEKITAKSDFLLSTSYRRESQTIVDDIIVEHNVSTVSNDIYDKPEIEVSNDTLLPGLSPGIVNRIVNDKTITEVVNLGDCVNITITTITESTLSDSINDTVVLSHFSSTINNNPNDSVNETVVVTNTGAAIDAGQISDVIDPSSCENKSDATTEVVNNYTVQEGETLQKDDHDVIEPSPDALEIRSVLEPNTGTSNADTKLTSDDSHNNPKSKKSTKDKKKQKSDEKKLKKESKKKQKSTIDKQNSKPEEPESPGTNVSDLISKFEGKGSGNKKLKISLSKSSSKSDDEKKIKKKKKEKKEKGQKSPSIDEENEHKSPIKGIFDDVPVEIEVHDVDTVSLSSLSSDETETIKKVNSKNLPIKKELSSTNDEEEINVLKVDTGVASRPRSDEYVVLLSINKDENQTTETSEDKHVQDATDINDTRETNVQDHSETNAGQDNIIQDASDPSDTQETIVQDTSELSDTRETNVQDHSGASASQETIVQGASDRFDVQGTTVEDASDPRDALENIVQVDQTGSVNKVEIKPVNSLEQQTTDSMEIIANISRPAEQSTEVILNQNKTKVDDLQRTEESDNTTSKKKSKKESKKKRGSKLFVFRNNSDASKEKDLPQQEVSFNQDPQSSPPRERRRSFSEFLRPVFGNIFTKNSPSSTSKRKSKIEVEGISKAERVDTEQTESKEKEETETSN